MSTLTGFEAYDSFCFPRKGGQKPKSYRRPLSERQTKVYNLASVGWNQSQIAERMRIPVASVYDALAKLKHWGYEI